MSPAQLTVLEALQAAPQGLTLAQLSGSMSLHPNTVREHLDALTATALVRRSKAAPDGRGRPAWVYVAAPPTAGSPAQEYAGLATTLAAALHQHSPRPAHDARAAGRQWGLELAAGVPTPPGTPAVRPRRALLEMLDRLQFAPSSKAWGGPVRLTRCPLLDAAGRYPDVVCSVHQGLVEGALAHWGDATTSVRLEPFAEPGACLLHLTPSSEGAAS